jgi:hypothetical protein
MAQIAKNIPLGVLEVHGSHGHGKWKKAQLRLK